MGTIRVRVATLAALTIVTLLCGACAGGFGVPRDPAASRSLRSHTTWTETFVDPSRPTVPSSGPVSSSRTLVSQIYRPAGRGPFPLIVFAHGLSGHPDKFTKLFAAWADAGYAIAAPAFPLTNNRVPNPPSNLGDVAQQPADLSFVLDQVLALDADRNSRLFGAIDEDTIGAGGLSLGGLTVYNLAYGACCRDERIDSVAVLDGFQPGVAVDGHVPLLIAHSDTDPVIPYANARATYAAAPPPVWLHTLHGASHASQWEDPVTPYDEIAEQVTVDFWDATLEGRRLAYRRLERDATVPGLSAIVAKCASTTGFVCGP